MSQIETDAIEDLAEVLEDDWHKVTIWGVGTPFTDVYCYFRRTSGEEDRTGAYLVADRETLTPFKIGDTVIFESMNYTVAGIQPDGNVSTRLLLEEPAP